MQYGLNFLKMSIVIEQPGQNSGKALAQVRWDDDERKQGEISGGMKSCLCGGDDRTKVTRDLLLSVSSTCGATLRRTPYNEAIGEWTPENIEVGSRPELLEQRFAPGTAERRVVDMCPRTCDGENGKPICPLKRVMGLRDSQIGMGEGAVVEERSQQQVLRNDNNQPEILAITENKDSSTPIEPIIAFMQTFGLNLDNFQFRQLQDLNEEMITKSGRRNLKARKWYGWVLLNVMFGDENSELDNFEIQEKHIRNRIAGLDDNSIVSLFREYAEALGEVRQIDENKRNFTSHLDNKSVNLLLDRSFPKEGRGKWFNMNMIRALDTILNGPKNQQDLEELNRKRSVTGVLSGLAGQAIVTARKVATVLQSGSKAMGRYVDLGDDQRWGSNYRKAMDDIGCVKKGDEVIEVGTQNFSGSNTTKVEGFEVVDSPDFKTHCANCLAARLCARRDNEALALEFAAKLKNILKNFK